MKLPTHQLKTNPPQGQIKTDTPQPTSKLHNTPPTLKSTWLTHIKIQKYIYTQYTEACPHQRPSTYNSHTTTTTSKLGGGRKTG